MIKFKKLTMNNFFSYEHEEIDFNMNGLILISSNNGCGKSTIFEAIIWALSGNTLKGVPADNVVNNKFNTNCYVTLDMNINGVEYSVSRYRFSPEHGNNLVLIKECQDISSRLNKDTQNTLNNILGVPYNVLTNAVILGEAMTYKFTSMNDRQQKELIESMLAIQYDIKASQDKAKSEMSSKTIKSSSETKALETSTKMLEDLSNHNIKDLDEYRKSIHELSDKVKKAADDISNKSSNILKVENTLNDIRIKSIEASKLESFISNCNNQFSKIADQIRKLKFQDVKLCPTCNQPLSNDKTIELMKKYQDELNNIANDKEEKNKQLSEIGSSASFSDYIKTATAEIAEMKTSLSLDRAEYTNLVGSLEAAKRDLQLAVTYDDMKSELQNKINESNEKIKELDKEIKIYNYATSLFKPTGLMLYIINNALSYINDRITKYTSVLLNRSYKFILVKDKLTLKDENGISYQSLSSGEKKRLDIAIQFALNDYLLNYCGVKFNMLFLDEITESLDNNGIENIIEILNIKFEYNKFDAIMIITHLDYLKNYFENTIEIIKDEKGSHIIK